MTSESAGDDLIDIGDEMLFMIEFIRNDLGELATPVRHMNINKLGDQLGIAVELVHGRFVPLVRAKLKKCGYLVLPRTKTSLFVAGPSDAD